MSACLIELRASRRGELDHVTLESSFFHSFDASLKRDLGPIWHKLSVSTKQLLADVRDLRQLAAHVLRYDAISFYRYLLTMRHARKGTSLWLQTGAADNLFALAKARVYSVAHIEVRNLTTVSSSSSSSSSTAICNHSVSTMHNPLVKAAASTFRAPPSHAAAGVLPTASSTVKAPPNTNSITLQPCTHLEAEIELVWEQMPKWNVLSDILDEVRLERARMLQHAVHPALHTGTHDDDCIISSPSSSSSSSTSSVATSGTNISAASLLPGPTLIVAKDDGTCQQIQSYLERGGERLMAERWTSFLYSQRCHEHPLFHRHVWTESDILQHTGNALQREQLALAQELLVCRSDEYATTTGVVTAANAASAAAAVTAAATAAAKRRKTSIASSAHVAPRASTAHSAASSARPPAADIVDAPPELHDVIRDAPGQVFDLLPPHDSVMLHTFEHAHVQLGRIQPTFVVLFDPDVAFIRQLEVYQATHTTRPLRVYILTYKDSVEMRKYDSTLRREKEAFQRLIEAKANMVIPAAQDGKVDIDALTADLFTATSELESERVNSRKGGAARAALKPGDEARSRVLVDTREFRSALPSCIFAHQLRVVPMTLTVGDYLLTPTTAVERKSLDDLVGSFQSGRLHTQMISLCRHFQRPMLLIEFDPSRPFELSAYSSASTAAGAISAMALSSRLALLVLHFPQLRLLWSRSPAASASMFVQLKRAQPEPDEDTGAGVSSATMALDAGDSASAALTPEDILRRLPGVTDTNVCALVRHVKNLAELCTASRDTLTRLMGAPNAARLHSFLNADATKFVV